MHVVVVAYGPRAVTRVAVGRVRQWGSLVSAISVVPASPVSYVAPETFDGVRISTVAGTAGVREVAGDEPALVIHDDVGLGAGGAGELIAALSTSEFATAATGGSSLGFACFAANSLAEIDAPIVIPGASPAFRSDAVSLIDLNANHGASCRAHLVEDHLDPKNPLLVASMIVKDEEHRLPEALASVGGLVDRLDICDTGSTDRTLNVIRRYRGNVREVEWRNDFAWARNQALEMCQDAPFALFLDADERVVCRDAAKFRRWLRTWGHEFDAISLRLDNEQPDGATSSINILRIGRPAVSTFTGAVHETLTLDTDAAGSTGRIIATSDLTIHHVGYRSDIVAERDKHRRNIDIARAAHDAEPSPKTAVDLARSLLAADPADAEGAALFETVGHELGPDTSPAGHSYVFASRAQQAFRRDELERSVDLARRAIDHTPNEDIALVTAAAALLELGRPDELIALHDDSAGRPPGTPLFTVPRNMSRYEAMVGHAYIQTGRPERGVDMLERAMHVDAAGVADLVATAIPEAVAAGVDLSALTSIVAHDETGQVVGALAAAVPPATTSSVCLAGLMMGTTHPPVVTVQLTAALVAGADDLVEAGLVFADTLDATARQKLAGLAMRKGREHVARQLAAPTDSPIVPPS